MMNKKAHISNSVATGTGGDKEAIFDSDPLYARLQDLGDNSANDLMAIFKSIDGFRNAGDDRGLESNIRQRVSGKMFILENMGKSDYYKRRDGPSRTVASRLCIGQNDRTNKGLDDLSKLTFSDLERLNGMWQRYAITVVESLSKLSTSSISPAEYMHDFYRQHLELVGSKIEIVHSQNPQLIGFGGLVYRENENSFEIMSQNNKRRIIPKDVVTIRVLIGNHASDSLILRGPDLAGIGRTGSIYRASQKVTKRRQNHSLSYS